jgi:hypothetical protein
LQPDSLLHPRKDVVDPLEQPQPTAIAGSLADRGEHLRSTESTGDPAARVDEGAVLGVSVLPDTTIPSRVVVVSVLSIVDDPIWEQTPE